VFRKKNIKRCAATQNKILLQIMFSPPGVALVDFLVPLEYFILSGASHHLKPFCKKQNTPAI
jgi:hypothetical protein